MQRTEFVTLIKQLLAPWTSDPTKETLQGYANALDAVDDSTLRQAMAEVGRTRKREAGQPSPADILHVAYQLRKQAAGLDKATPDPLPPAMLGKLSRIIAEVAFDAKPRNLTLLERKASEDFGNLLHQSMGLFEHGIRRSVKLPVVTPAHLRALLEVGGFEGLKDLESHEVIVARDVFVKAFVSQPGPQENA
jgi:hypothetical protein